MTEKEFEDFICAVAVVFGFAIGIWLGCRFIERLSADSPLLRIPVGRTAQREWTGARPV